MPNVRDRFDDLQKLHCEDEMEKGNKKEENMEKILKEYISHKCEDIRQKINHIRDDTYEVNDILLHKQFYRLQDLQDNINPIIKRSEEACVKIHNRLNDMSMTPKDLELEPTAETKMKYMVYIAFREEFKDVINSQLECIKRYEVFLEEFKKKILQSIPGENFIETKENINKSQAFIGNYLLEKHAGEFQLRDAQERHNQLVIIENQLTDLRNLFVKIAILLEEQQKSVNRAEHHAVIINGIVENANDELLETIEEKEKRNCNTLYCILLGIFLTIKIIFLMIKFL